MKSSVAVGAIFILAIFARKSLSAPTEPELKWMIIQDMHNHLHYINLNEPVPQIRVNNSEITFYYFSRNTKSFEFTLDNVKSISTTDFNPSRKTMFIIHGWTSNGKSEMNDLVTSALLNVDDWNLFNVDWSGPAGKNYISSKGSLPGVANIVADVIKYLSKNEGLKLDDLYITGHSLGGQMAGYVGAALDGYAGFIVGLDPALPLFSYDNLADRLDPSDAQHVQVIHTNGGLLGYMKPLGHSDFYPNGGAKQKGCTNDYFGMCSHIRAYIYFAESIESGRFLSHTCEDFNRYLTGDCHGNHFANMGGNVLDASSHGDYYLTTNDQEPFALY